MCTLMYVGYRGDICYHHQLPLNSKSTPGVESLADGKQVFVLQL